MSCDLAAELASDGAAATSYQNGFSTDVTEYLVHVYLDGISSKKVFYGYIFHFAKRNFSSDELIDTWRIFISHFVSLQIFMISRRSAGLALGMAIRI